jgi:hypothetical protein
MVRRLFIIASIFILLLPYQSFAEDMEASTFVTTLNGTWIFSEYIAIPGAATLPATCVANELYIDTDATTGERLYLCESANSWVLQGDGGGAGDVTDVFECATGDCNIVTIGSGEYLDGGTATVDSTNEGILLPRAADCSGATSEGQICWDTDGDALYIGDGAAAQAQAGSGDVTGVGDCASGACLDGTSDGGTNFAFYDGDSNKCTFSVGDLSGDITMVFPTDDGDANEFLQTAGNGTTTWSSIDDDDLTSEDFGEISCDGTEDGCTIENDVIGTSNMANADHGDISWSSNVATVDNGAVLLNEVGDPGASKTFGMGTYSLIFNYANVSADHAFELNAIGNFSKDLAHLHQHTGNPTAGRMFVLEWEDYNVGSGGATVIQNNSPGAGAGTDQISLLLTTDDDDDTDYVPLRIADDSGGNDDTLFQIDSAGTVEAGIWNAGAVTSSGTVEGATITEGGVAVHNNDEMDASSELAAIIDDETGTGVIVFGTSPQFTTSVEIPNGAAPTVDAAGEIAVDTTDDQLVYYGGAKRVLTYKDVIRFVLESPADADNILIPPLQDAITITGISCIVDPADSSESVEITVQERDGDGDSPTETEDVITCANTDTDDDGTMTDANIDANDYMSIDIGAVTGTVTQLAVSIYYTIDAE